MMKLLLTHEIHIISEAIVDAVKELFVRVVIFG
jgi:hypothetical protein